MLLSIHIFATMLFPSGMKSLIALPFVVLMVCMDCRAEAAVNDEEALSFRERIFFGGNFGLQLGTITNIELSPLVGYKITPDFSAGTGIRYEFYRTSGKYSYYQNSYSTSIYGSSVFTRYMFFRDLGEKLRLGTGSALFAHAEYEVLSLEKKYFEYPPPPPDTEGRFIVQSVLVGGGLFQPVGRRGGVLFMVLWNLNESFDSPYSNPIMRVGFIF